MSWGKDPTYDVVAVVPSDTGYRRLIISCRSRRHHGVGPPVLDAAFVVVGLPGAFEVQKSVLRTAVAAHA
jgi:hypothetical protein